MDAEGLKKDIVARVEACLEREVKKFFYTKLNKCRKIVCWSKGIIRNVKKKKERR